MIVRRATREDTAAIARIHALGWQVGYRGLFRQELLDALSVEQRTDEWIARLREGVVTWVSEDVGPGTRRRAAGRRARMDP